MNNHPEIAIPAGLKNAFGGTGGTRAVAELESLIRQLGPENDFSPSLAMAIEVMQEKMTADAKG